MVKVKEELYLQTLEFHFHASAKDESSGDLHFKNMFEREKQSEPEVTADTPISDIL